MGEGNVDKFIFPLTGLQIGDLQSYLSELSIFVAVESNKLYILVDNGPWLRELVARPAHIWQLMVTKSRLSPFANSKAQRRRRTGKDAAPRSSPREKPKPERWYKLIDAATLSRKRILLPVKKLRNPFFLSSELHRTLSGFIVFQVAWSDVRGINYLNQLQTDTSLAIESKVMRRWEFDSVEQAARCASSWFSGTPLDRLHLKEYLYSLIGEVFYDAKETFSKSVSIDDDANIGNGSLWGDENNSCCSSTSGHLEDVENETSEPHTPPHTGPYKRRRVTRSISTGIQINYYSEETQSGSEDSSDNCETHASANENAIEAKEYKDILISIRFNDHDLPFKLAEVIMADLRLLTLLEAGLPSWVIFLQSYPGFCNLYRPWMCPLARALYVTVSVVTVLIGFYDLYKNVPVLKVTASRLCGPLLDWIETWEMVSRIQYLGTMLFLHNFQKAVTWSLQVMRTARSFFAVLTQPLVDPFIDILDFFIPVWNIVFEVVRSLCSFVGVLIDSSCSVVGDLIEIVLSPILFVISVVWSLATSVLNPVFWIVWEVLYAPVRVVLAFSGFLAILFTWIWELVGDLWMSVSGLIPVASASKATVSTYEVSMWRSLWNDLFSQVFRAVRSILNGFVAFFAACNRHRLSIYNHMRRALGAAHSQPSETRDNRSTHRSQRSLIERRHVHVE